MIQVALRFEYETKEINKKKTYKVTQFMYVCPGCAAISDEIMMKHQPARWEADNPDAYAHGVRSFWLNAFFSQWANWKLIILKYLNAIGNSRKLRPDWEKSVCDYGFQEP